MPFIDSFDSAGGEDWSIFSAVVSNGTGRRGTRGCNVAQVEAVTPDSATIATGAAYKTGGFGGKVLYVCNHSIAGSTAELGAGGYAFFMRVTHIGDGRLRPELNMTGHASVYGTPTVRALSLNTWYYIELSSTLSTSGATYTIRINGHVETSGNIPLPLLFTPSDPMVWKAVGVIGDTGTYIDDFYEDDAGAFAGDGAALVLRPNAVGDASDWVASTPGDNYLMVDDIHSDGDATYVHSDTTPGDKDLYGLEDLAGGQTVFYLQTRVVSRRVTTDTGSLQTVLESGTTENLGAEFTPGTTYAHFLEGYLLSPFTAVAWTISEVNAMQLGQVRAS